MSQFKPLPLNCLMRMQAGTAKHRAHPTWEHFYPILVSAAAADGAPVSFPVEGFEYGNISRRCVQFG